MYKYILRFIQKYADYWGVEFETSLPPEFVITTHAELRMSQRIGCKKDKMAKIVKKAWLAGIPDAKILYTRTKTYEEGFSKKKYYMHYRELMGFIFVFALNKEDRGIFGKQKVLVTVYN